MSPAIQSRTDTPRRSRSGAAGSLDFGFEDELLRAGFSVANLARARGLSVRQFERRFHEQFGACPCVLVQEIRMRLASQRVISKTAFKEIAADLGYKHAADFSRAFQRYFGTNPAQLRFQMKRTSGPVLCMSPFANKMSQNAK